MLFHVVPDDSIGMPVFVGLDFLRQHKLVVNLCRRYIKYANTKTRDGWELYILPDGEYKLILSELVCRASINLDLDGRNGSQLIPVELDYPSHLMAVPDSSDMFFYNGEVRNKRQQNIQGCVGIIDLNDPHVILSAADVGLHSIKRGDIVGLVSTVVGIDPPEEALVNVVRGVHEDNFLAKLELGTHLTPAQV